MFFRKHLLEKRLLEIANDPYLKDIESLKACIKEIKGYRGWREKPSLDAKEHEIGGSALNLLSREHDAASLEMLTVLIEAGADLNVTDEFGWTALMHAAARGDIEMTEVLITSGADVIIKNHEAQSALDLCITGEMGRFVDEEFPDRFNFLSIARLLLVEGAEISSPFTFSIFLEHYLDYAIDRSFVPPDLLYCLNILCEQKEKKQIEMESLSKNELEYINSKNIYPNPEDILHQLSKHLENHVIEKVNQALPEKIPLEIIKLITSYDIPYRSKFFKTPKAHSEMKEIKEEHVAKGSFCSIQ